MSISTPIAPCLWFDHQLEEAAAFYVSVFPRSSIGPMFRQPADVDVPDGRAGAVLAGEFTIDGLLVRGINGGPMFAGFTETVSLAVTCADQAEVDHYWEALQADGGQPSQCGWLKDRFGLSWQVVPARHYELLADPDPAVRAAVIGAMMPMTRMVVADLEAAAEGVKSGMTGQSG